MRVVVRGKLVWKLPPWQDYDYSMTKERLEKSRLVNKLTTLRRTRVLYSEYSDAIQQITSFFISTRVESHLT